MDTMLNFQRSEDDNFYNILGCNELSTHEQILAEYKIRVLSCHPDKHPLDPSAANRFAQLQRAKDVLTDPKERKLYDVWWRNCIPIPYSQWSSYREIVQMSMHWAVKTQTEPMLESASHVDQTNRSELPPSYSHNSIGGKDLFPFMAWERDTCSEGLRKFRNYEI